MRHNEDSALRSVGQGGFVNLEKVCLPIIDIE